MYIQRVDSWSALTRQKSAGTILVVALLCISGVVSAGPVPPELCERLEAHGDLATLPDQVQALQLIFRLESPTSGAIGRLIPNRGGLSKGPATLPTDVLAKPGYYVGVTQATGEPRYLYLVLLADPSFIIAEAPRSKEGEIAGQVVRRAGGVLSTRVPFIPGGRLIICEVLAGKRTVIVDEELGPDPIPQDGTEFKGADP